MKDFIIVHDLDNMSMLINIHKITCIYWDEEENSFAIDIDHSTFYVKETVEEIESKIRYGM